jgi:hypothetical protein
MSWKIYSSRDTIPSYSKGIPSPGIPTSNVLPLFGKVFRLLSNTWNFSSYWKKEERIALAEDLIEKVCCNHSKCLFKLNLSRQVQVVGFSVSLGKDHDLIKGTNVYKHTANICCSPYLLCISGTISLLQIPGVDFGPHGKCTYSVYRESMLPWTLLDDR